MTTRHSVAWFGLVGAAAAATHAAVFALSAPAIWPELANALGFALAFFVSFFGHRWLSFQDAALPLWTSLRRFALTALAGFAANEVVFVLALRGLGWWPLAALGLGMLAAAGQTYVLARWWAFRR